MERDKSANPLYAAARDLAYFAGLTYDDAKEQQQPREQEYVVYNDALQSSARGLAYRLSKNMDDKDFDELVEWGTTVVGVNVGDGWIQVGSRYLPFLVENVRVLFPVEKPAETPGPDVSAIPEELPEETFREPKPLEGSVVEIFGMAGKLTRTLPKGNDEGEEVNVEGQQGLCIGWLEEEQSYVVHTFEGQLVAVTPESLRAWYPPSPEEGGFDVPWMGEAPDGEYFAAAVCERLMQKGYCVIQTFLSTRDRDEALENAEEGREFRRMKQELESAYLGIDNNTKIASLWPADATGVASDPAVDLEREVTEEAGPEAVLHACSRQMTDLGVLLSSWAPTQLGFACHSLVSTMVRTSIDKMEEDELFPESIADVEDEGEAAGLVEGFVRFAARRKLCFISMVENQGGDLWMYPRWDSDARSAARLPITPNKLVVFRHDLLDYSYQVVGPSLALQSWVVDAPVNNFVAIKNMQVDLDAASDLRQVITNPSPATAEGPKASIMAISVRNSGDCWSPEMWWNAFMACCDCDVHWPATRWETEPYYEEGDALLTQKSYTCHGGFLSDAAISRFDNDFFEIKPDEASIMIPGQRLVLEVGYATLYKSGYRKGSLRGRRIGTWIGDVGPDWNSMQTDWGRFHVGVDPSKFATSMACIVTANRLSHIYDMKGPTASFDTACSASLIALNAAHAAMFRRPEAGQSVPRALNDRGMLGEDCTEALVGGVNTLLNPASFVGNCMAGILTRKGRCFTFTESADGYQRADACGMLFMRLFEGDREDSERRIACVRGTCANADGKSASLTAPSGPAQQKLLRKSLAFSGVDPGMVSYAECHGTGTSLGDPIEVGAMQAVLCEKREFPVIAGSHKSNTGHSEAAAGISGLTKCILFVAMQAVPPNVHFNRLNPNIAAEGFPTYFSSEAVDTGFSECHTGVSSFGFGGSNARTDISGQALRGPREMLQVDLPRVNFPREVPIGQTVYVCGSWSGWSEVEPMEGGRNGVYKCHVALGVSGREEFFLTCDRDGSLSSGKRQPATIHPLVSNAGRDSQVVGPDVQGRDLHFLIDGAADNAHAGAVYQIEFVWTEETKSVSWTTVEPTDSESLAVIGSEFEHRYYLAGSWLRSGELQEMMLQEDGTFEASFQVGPRAQEEFYIVCDRDKRQLIFPESARTWKEGGQVFGPNDMRGDRSWLVRGSLYQAITIRLSIPSSEMMRVTVSSSTLGTRRWGS
mmetsp:Transcript_11240/g.30068  ORF Transcript_11240/g.30068 Transcript_11240/m.30068 type:complete len:1216 (+) Transcript_11240:115-3762(+)